MKDCLPPGYSTNVVYAIKCKTCDQEYVCETKRAVKVRCQEHKVAIRLGQTTKSAVAEHVHSSAESHEIDWENVNIVDRAKNTRERRIREAFHIAKRKPDMNRVEGIERSMTWNAII